MFGENPMLGERIVKKDIKGRIALPVFTNKEYGDNLVLVREFLFNSYSIYDKQTYYNQIIDYNKLETSATNDKERCYYKKLVYKMCRSILQELSVDRQGRVNINKIFKDTNKIKVLGIVDHVELQNVKVK